MPPPTMSRRELALVVVEGPDRDARLVVDRELTIGSSELADFVLKDRAVSRRHLLARPGQIGIELVDAESRNGTWLDPHRVHRIDLAVDAQVRIGTTVLQVAVTDHESRTPSTRTSFGRFLGSARCLAPLYQALEAASGSDVTVLLEGESGTGKELLSEALHEQGARREGPFVVVDCGSLPENLIESELFGHVRGAFTGATSDRRGAFEQANGGTVFLDEIGELPLAMQSRLLRALDSRRVRRVGGDAFLDVDVRVIAATNRNLEREVEDGRFRLDLFHRLAVLLVRVPPLRARLEDLDMLVPALLNATGSDLEVTSDALQKLRAHHWPGNVRELRNHLERLALLGEAPLTQTGETSDTLEELARAGHPFRVAKAKALARFTALYVENMLARHDGNVSHAAAAAGVARRHFQRLKSSSND